MDLYQIDFSDPQGGKGPCDRKAVQIKMHVKQYINQGHSVTTPTDLKKAIKSNEGIAGVLGMVVVFLRPQWKQRVWSGKASVVGPTSRSQ